MLKKLRKRWRDLVKMIDYKEIAEKCLITLRCEKEKLELVLSDLNKKLEEIKNDKR